MIEVIYMEDGIRDHPRSQEILARFPRATVLPCKHYKEVFNPAGQSFRLQKKKPALILAQQTGKLIHPIPPSYGVGGTRNFYFSHLLNCLYDCRYCFLQGMYPSAHYLMFVNFEDFEEEIVRATKTSKQQSWFFSGYDCDSLALESVTGFADHFLPFFKKLDNAWIELRTKSVATRVLRETEPLERAVVAFSFTPQEISTQLEHGVPSVDARVRAMLQLAEQGWKIGLRIDPLIDCTGFKDRYAKLFENIFTTLSEHTIHSVSLGAFRMPHGFFKKMEKHYPEEPLFASDLESKGGIIAYREHTEKRLKHTCFELLEKWVSPDKIFTCEA